jgi:hypothetical protein
VAGTLAVRTVVLRFRGGGDARATSITRHSVAGVVMAGLAGLTWLVIRDALPPATLVAAAPGLVLALGIVARPPRPARLRTIGWTLVGTSVFAAAVLVGTA